MEKTKILIIEDHPMFRERVAQVINAEDDMQLVAEADTIESARAALSNSEVNFLIVDVSLAGENALSFVKELREQKNETPILVLSMHEESIYAERALRSGANGYITKNQAAGNVISAIRRVRSGDVYLSEKATSDLAKRLQSGRPGATRAWNRLTDREIDVLRLLGEGRTTREIAESLKLGVSSVDTYRARIKEKMNLRNGVELQHFATLWAAENK